ncbi:MAG TPA: hypothetical protein VFL94_15975 [Actinomycetales bacterium]|nr:hypothetical protein [Actinomycetales bacterium]
MPTHAEVPVERLWTTYPSLRSYAYLGPSLGWLRVRSGRDDTDALLTALQAARAARSAVTVLTDAAESVVEQVYL